MITSHGYQAHSLHHPGHPHQAQIPPGAHGAAIGGGGPPSSGSLPGYQGFSSSSSSGGGHSGNSVKEESEERDMTSSVRSDSGNGDPFSSAASFGDDDFDIPPINIPPSALEDNPQNQGSHHPGYHYSQQHHQQHQSHHQMQWNQQQTQQHQWGYQHPHMNGYQYPDHHQQQQQPQHYGYSGGYSSMYGQHQPQQQSTHVMPGGPSPVGSHNTPSPQAHSEDGDDHIRNNNVLKRPSPDMYGPHRHMMHMSHAHPGVIPPGHVPVVTAKKPKMSKRKKKRDPNEPQKPVSAYALFFRDRQAAIKVANPNAAFGDVSKIVASMWDGLDPDSKAAYKKRTENAKKEYLKKLAAYRASLVSKGNGDHMYNPYGFAAFADGSSVHKPAGYAGQSADTGYGLGQPIPPRPPMQHLQNMSHQGGVGGAYCNMVHQGIPPSQEVPLGHPQVDAQWNDTSTFAPHPQSQPQSVSPSITQL
ncbi:thymocyte selection-associated high mobility group box protein TOX-like isoform X2 [Tigriopus californicus]|uniref:thymocyte selection-associated high mobility group box protein TOX-like isoform X2 n=1 Tax=Tigriopus californicus TaxID=6832 RepID=UPI0027DA054B|nr:thymocyte selection-associated high mobility group box protein TOX-like isoform X2 [Tigriopus californicus]